ncbi:MULTISPECIES: DUF1918 domain-containing protein [unclassified Modestobacter]|uniref:DUF1918 domain-containing protein n=1 Tax=unclassified Modestobacter TaxID=2643866 RepID=UPI0022AA7628|nr:MULTISPECIES: DUF1918 domain-containing protein [unclassified Modestobacter]MCZ2812066.1 DUF1918 domain-containing protein [Modestobacter sp. VKM Ac-2979]MCZ2843790.1 DUF1918 domain-containing protein [Modestobacter sp. VKM Ac-2980]MCZ2849763.1 DUF1918 domain-containing protein [Modestobacter sp. VKM Ac-2978]
MRAEVGNWLVVRNRLLDRPVRAGEIVEVPHADGSPPWTVHWLDDERTSVVFPGSDAVVMTAPPSRADVPTHT